MSKDTKDDGAEGHEVGYGKPPKSTQFGKGTSGNPKGRPRGAKNIRTILEEMGRKRINVTSNGKTSKLTMLQAMVMQLINRAASGDLKAIREVLAAHRIFVEPEPATEPGPERQEREETVLKNLQRRFQEFNKVRNPEENN